MTVVFMLAAIAVIAVVALLAVGRLGELPDVEGDRAPLALPDDRPLDGDDVDGVRFAVGLRGYRMDEVDDVLDRLSGDIAARDARIAVLESQLAGGASLVGTQDSPPVLSASAPDADPEADSTNRDVPLAVAADGTAAWEGAAPIDGPAGRPASAGEDGDEVGTPRS